MKYTIKVQYTTGDSFHTEETEDTVDLEWEKLDVAKEAVKRIKEHYEWFRSLTYSHLNTVKRPSWHKTNMENDKSLYMFVINFPLDDGNEQQMSAFWCGYFEHLHAAEIVPAKSVLDQMRIEV